MVLGDPLTKTVSQVFNTNNVIKSYSHCTFHLCYLCTLLSSKDKFCHGSDKCCHNSIFEITTWKQNRSGGDVTDVSADESPSKMAIIRHSQSFLWMPSLLTLRSFSAVCAVLFTCPSHNGWTFNCFLGKLYLQDMQATTFLGELEKLFVYLASSSMVNSSENF